MTTNDLNSIARDIAITDLDVFWPGFKKAAFAVYDENNVYLFNHPAFNDSQGYQTLKWNEQFTGETLILYEEYPTAIVNLELHKDYESLFSILIHELFHGYQYLIGEKRFPNEMLGFMYPLSKENIEIRNQERENLFHALMTKNSADQAEYLNRFIALREKRASEIEEYLEFENLIETVEGPAWYVELKAYSHKSSQPYESVLKKYGQSLIDKLESSLNIRRSCYSSGLFMCLLLDQLSPRWQETFFVSENSLFEFFKEQYKSLNISTIESFQISDETEEIVHTINKSKQSEFESFVSQDGIYLYIEGNIRTASFDPMNIIALEDKLLHKNFIKVLMNNEAYLIQQPVIAHFKDNFKEITKLYLQLSEMPRENNDSIIIDGVGEIKGVFNKEANTLYLL